MKSIKDVFERKGNQVPFCFNDAQKVVKEAIKEDDLEVRESVYQAI